MIRDFHLALAWDWEHDRDFMEILQGQIHAQGMLFYSITHHNTAETLRKVQKGEIAFAAMLDRADSDANFQPVTRAIRKTASVVFNPPEKVERAIDKATMHMEFLTKGIRVPFTIIISPYNKKSEIGLTLTDLANLGRPFIIKPANTTGGGIGVILGAETLKDVIESRQHHKNDKYLLQERVSPVYLNWRKAWFRVFCVFDAVIPCWWDDETHHYHIVTRQETLEFGLRPLITMTRKISEVCGLDFFSTEIALSDRNRFVSVDYVNDICDMRLQSRTPDGVPDVVVTDICRRIAQHLKRVIG